MGDESIQRKINNDKASDQGTASHTERTTDGIGIGVVVGGDTSQSKNANSDKNQWYLIGVLPATRTEVEMVSGRK